MVYQSENSLGWSYAGLGLIVEGLHTKGYIDDADYELYKNKYNVGLSVEKPKSPVQIQKEQTREAFCKAQNKHFGEVLAQWSSLKTKTKQFHLKKAGLPENKNIKNAKLILELGEQEGLVNVNV